MIGALSVKSRMKMKHLVRICVVTAALMSIAVAAPKEEPAEETELPVGQQAPGFTLQDQAGREVSLETLLRKGPVAVVFFRSADWCLYCKLQLVQLQRNLKEIKASGGQVVCISYDPVEKLKSFADRQKISFPLLSDIGSKTIDAYGMRAPDGTAQYAGVSRHATFVLDQKGVIREKFSVLSYEDRPAISALVKALKQAQTVKGGIEP